jgi:hypothetical protein
MLLTSYAFLLMFTLPTYLSLYPYSYKKAVVLIIFTATFVSPLLVMMIFLNLRKIQSLHFIDRKERIFPFFTAFVLYLSAWLIMLNFPGGTPVFLSNFILCSTVILLVIILITLKYKISIHMAGLGGFIGYFYIWFAKISIPDVLFIFSGIHFSVVHFFALLFIITGITASSRLMLKAHNPLQIITGFFTGLLLGLASVFLY